jgi:hypothetical protein
VNEALGYAASLAVLATFLMQSMFSLRIVAILSNLLFVSYGYRAHIHPVLLLHSALLPINLARLAACRPRHAAGKTPPAHLADPNAGTRRLAFFALGLVSGFFGLRAVMRIARQFVDQYHRNSI